MLYMNIIFPFKKGVRKSLQNRRQNHLNGQFEDTNSLSPIQADDDAGFTLIEVMVALAIFSIAVVAMITAQNENIRTITILEERAMAEIAAENILVETITAAGVIPVGFSSGQIDFAGRPFDWRRQVIETSSPSVHRVTVSIYNRGDNHALQSFTALRKAD
jgi:general secretion pathway protein I